MGIFYSYNLNLDSIECVNNTITSLIYMPPIINKTQIINYYENMPNSNLFSINSINKFNNNLSVCVCEINPIINVNKNNILIFSHSNGCDIFTFGEYLHNLSKLLNIIVVSYDYPKYGLSKGKLDETNCCLSLELVINHYKKLNNNIILVGQSLGTGIIIDYVSKNTWNNPIILISPYKSIPNVACDAEMCNSIIENGNYNSYSKIINVTCPVKIFHGTKDETINISNSIELYEKIENKKFKPTWFENIGHNDILNKINAEHYNEIINYKP